MRIDPSIPVLVVPKKTIRELFNLNHYWDRARGPDREFEQQIERDVAAPTSAKEPRGTKSQMITYLNSVGQPVALVHQYKRRDGTLGGGGRPDPKFLVHQGVEYRADPDDPDP
jgi:hypothetical protein